MYVEVYVIFDLITSNNTKIIWFRQCRNQNTKDVHASSRETSRNKRPTPPSAAIIPSLHLPMHFAAGDFDAILFHTQIPSSRPTPVEFNITLFLYARAATAKCLL